MAMLRRVALDQAVALNSTLDAGGITLDLDNRLVHKRDSPLDLRFKEFELLALLMANAGQVVSRADIFDKVWGTDWLGDTRTLDGHIRWLREKIEENPHRPTLIQTVRGVGYRFIHHSPLAIFMPASLRARLIAVYLALILFGFGGLTLWAAIQITNAASAYGESVRAYALEFSNQLVDPLEDGFNPRVQTMLNASAGTFNAQLTLFDTNGLVLAATDGSTDAYVSADTYTYQRNALGSQTVYSTQPILYEGTTLAFIQVAAPATVPQAEAHRWAGRRLRRGFRRRAGRHALACLHDDRAALDLARDGVVDGGG